VKKRYKKKRCAQIRAEILAVLAREFPHVTYLHSEDRPGSKYIICVSTPLEDELEVMASLSRRLIDIQIDEGLDVLVLALPQQADNPAA
jgi:hypothetical protein